MAQSRLEKIGTIYTRIRGLIQAGAVKFEDRPLWYEVYKAFPPELEPRFDRPIMEKPIRQIFYPEDVIRAKFYNKVLHLPTINISDSTTLTLSQKFLKLCYEIQKEKCIPLEDTFNEAFERINIDLLEHKTPSAKSEFMGKKEKSNISKLDIKDILKDS